MEKLSDIQYIFNKEEASLQLPKINDTKYPIIRVDKSPCKASCPIDTDVKAYLGLTAAGRFEEALEIVKRDNPFPGICGRACIHYCEDACTRNDLDKPVSICAIKRFLADYELQKGRKKNKSIKQTKKEKIAIIGSGPAGLTAASDLIRLGYGVTVFEELPKAGGMVYSGIPKYRLPRNIIDDEVAAIEELGVEIKTKTRITDPNRLKEQGYSSVFLAIGAHKALKLYIPGEDEYTGFLDCISFLRDVNFGKKVKIGKRVIVIGGGNAAIDSARTALRIGCDDVNIVYRRSKKEMPANQWEIDEAEEEGVKFHYFASPVKIIGENGKVTAMECIRNELGAPDSSGRRRPVPIENSEFKITADTIIPAISQEPDISFLPKDHGLDISKWNSIIADEETLETNIPGIFAGGDCVTGVKTIIEAIEAGHRVSKSIVNYLSGNGHDGKYNIKERTEFEVILEPRTREERIEIPSISLDERKSFKEVSLGYTEEMAVAEAKRCLRCGQCIECYQCVAECKKRHAILTVSGESSGTVLRVPFDPYRFPINGGPIEGQLLWGKNKKQPVEMQIVNAHVMSELCRGCGDCVEICIYNAPKLQDMGNGVFISKIDENICKGCGACVSICPSSAIKLNHISDEQIRRLTTEILAKNDILGFVCHWSSQATSDVEDIEGLKMIRVLCSSRINPTLIVNALEQGAKGVLGIGCDDSACHYNAVKSTTEHYNIAKNIIETLGLEPKRIRFERTSPDQPGKINKVIRSFCKTIEGLK